MAEAWNGFKGAAKPIEDRDIPRIAHRIGVGEDELHAFMEVEAADSGFDKQGRPKMLFEPHIFYRQLPAGAQRDAAVKAGLAYKDWVRGKYPRDSYPRLLKAIAINETAALKSASWGWLQVMGFNHKDAGYDTVQSMVTAFMADEENHLDAAVNFIIAKKIDDDLRVLAKLTRPTTPNDCRTIVMAYNGEGYEKNDYHTKFAKAHNKWRKIKDTPWSPEGQPDAPLSQPVIVAAPVTKPVEIASDKKIIEQVQILLRDKGYPEVGEPDGIYGDRTHDTIVLFQSRNNLPVTGQVTDELLAQLIRAARREMAPARAEATAKDLKEAAPVKDGDWLKKIGTTILVTSGIGGVLDGTGTIENAVAGIGKLKTLVETVMTISPWILVAAAGGAVFVFGRKIIKDHVTAYQDGRAL